MNVECVVCELDMTAEEAFESWESDGEAAFVCSERCARELRENPELFGQELEDEPERSLQAP